MLSIPQTASFAITVNKLANQNLVALKFYAIGNSLRHLLTFYRIKSWKKNEMLIPLEEVIKAIIAPHSQFGACSVHNCGCMNHLCTW